MVGGDSRPPGCGPWSAAAVIIGLGWSAYAQGVRAETPAAAFLSFQNQPAWLFGTIAQRLDPGEWRLPLVVALMLTGSGFVVWAPLAVLRARRVPQAGFALGLLAVAAGTPLILFNLYVVHDYYFSAVAPLVAIGIGLGADQLLGHRTRRWAKRTMVGLAGAWIATLIGLFGSWSIIYGTPAEETRALHLAGTSPTTPRRTTGSCSAAWAGTRASSTTHGARASRSPITTTSRTPRASTSKRSWTTRALVRCSSARSPPSAGWSDE